MEKRKFNSVEGISVIFSKLTVNTFLKQLGQLGTFSLSPFPLILSGRDQQCLPLDKVRKTLSGGRIICYRKIRASLRITLPWRSWADLGGLLWNSITDTEKRKKSIYLKTLMGSTPNVGNRIGEVASPPDILPVWNEMWQSECPANFTQNTNKTPFWRRSQLGKQNNTIQRTPQPAAQILVNKTLSSMIKKKVKRQNYQH